MHPRLHQAALEAAGDHPGRPRPEILRNLRPVRAEERPALRRHLGQGLAAVPRLRRLPAAGREVRRTQARAGPAPGDQPEQRPVPEERLQLLDEQLATVTRLAKDNELPDAILTESGLKITPLDAAVPDRAQALIDQTSQLLPRIKITELLMDVDDWTGFSRHFTHLKDGAEAKDRTLLLSAILGDAINLGLTKMAESSPGLTYAKLSRLQAWHIRDETYSGSVPAEGEMTP